MSFLDRFQPTSANSCGSAPRQVRAATAALVAVLAAGLCFPAWAQGNGNTAAPVGEGDAINVFEMPQLAAEEQLALSLIQSRRYPDAERVLGQIAARFPQIVAVRYRLAQMQAVLGKNDQAIENLKAAIEHGFRNPQMLRADRAFTRLRNDPRFKTVLNGAEGPAAAPAARPKARVVPAKVENGIAKVEEANTVWNPRARVLFSLFRFESDKPSTLSVRNGNGPADQMLNNLYVARRAAGNHMDLYDNRDRGHSKLRSSRYPQLTFVEYGAAAKKYGADYGLNGSLIFNQITFGNSSTAYVGGADSRSLASVALTRPNGALFLYEQYRSNQLYVYPEHRDHDPDRGDLIPANTPYLLISQGSSGSDRPLLDAVADILAAFKPETKDFLRKKKLVMPTVQMVFRWGMTSVHDIAGYLDGRAHPSVFDAKDFDVAKMVKVANNLGTDQVPPVVELKVVEESQPRRGIDYFSGGPDERFFDTPSAISRVYRSVRYEHRMVVSAGNTKDPNGRKLTFHWVVLRGDADRIRINPADKSKTVAEIIIPWHERRNVPGRKDLTTDRVDIGVFADNGINLSAPAFISFVFPGDQKRTYDANHRLVSIDYNDPALSKRYIDPLLFPKHEWRDVYQYDGQGRMIGWTRTHGGQEGRFTRDGALVVATDSLGRPTRAQIVGYRITRAANQPRAVVVETPIEKFLGYSYANSRDRYGVMTPQ